MNIPPRTTLFYDRYNNINHNFVWFEDREYKKNEKTFFLYRSSYDATAIAETASSLLPINIDSYVTEDMEEISIKINPTGFDIEILYKPYSYNSKTFHEEPTADNIETRFIEIIGEK